MDLDLSNKVVMVAAASKGLGYGIAQACAAEGAKVSIASRNAEHVEQAVKQLRSDTESQVIGHCFDAQDGDSIESWVDATKSEFGAIDGLVVNAGGPPTGTFDSFDDSAWQQAFELTLLSSIRMIRSVLPQMKTQASEEQQQGAILTVTSSTVREPVSNLILSNVFRSGVSSLVKSLASELGPHGIRINNLVPGRIDTDRVKSLDAGAASAQGVPVEEIQNRFHSAVPLGRYGEPIEFGKAGAFLLSDAASYITGATLLVDGGAAKSIW